MSDDIRVPITDKTHRVVVGEFIGFAGARQALEEHAETFGKMPGYNSARAIVDARYEATRMHLYALNVKAAAKAGVDMGTHAINMTDGVEVVCTAIEPAQFDLDIS